MIDTNIRFINKLIRNRKPSLEITPITLATFLADSEFSAGSYHFRSAFHLRVLGCALVFQISLSKQKKHFHPMALDFDK